MTQYDRILNHLLTKGKISQKRAIDLYGAYRLSAIIYTMKKNGLTIETKFKTGKNRFGEPTHWAEYILIK